MFGLRLKEARAAGKVLGLASVECLDYPDGELSEAPLNELRRHHLAAIRRLRPDIVFTFDPWAPYENHQDHRAVAWAAMEATSFAHFPLYEPQQLAQGVHTWLVPEVYYFAKSPRDVNRHVDISGEPVRKKIEALYCFDSQMALTVADAQQNLAAAPFDVPALSSLDPHDYRDFIERRVLGTAAAIGRKYGVEHAEHFRRTRWGGSERLVDASAIPPDDF
jgi:LmbE family N-acetylglucosaminyl deacetylase